MEQQARKVSQTFAVSQKESTSTVSKAEFQQEN